VDRLIEGGSLLQLMRTYGTHTEVTAANLVAQVLEGLHYMHQNGVIHRDIKAANLMADKTGKVVIGDFGLAKELYAGGEQHSTVGTPHWRAFPPVLPSHRSALR
jgi:serine/threonine protein kinase